MSSLENSRSGERRGWRNEGIELVSKLRLSNSLETTLVSKVLLIIFSSSVCQNCTVTLSPIGKESGLPSKSTTAPGCRDRSCPMDRP